MALSIIVAASIVAAGPRVELPRIAVADFVPNGVDAQTSLTFTRLVAAELSRTGRFEVISHDDVVAMAGMERWKQLLGCAAATCLLEAGALGDLLQARYLLAGSIGKTGGTLVVNAQMIDATRSRVSSRAARRMPSIDVLAAEADALVRELLADTATLHAYGQIDGGTLFIDDKPVAAMPAQPISLRLAGTHRVRAECPDCVPWETDVEFVPGRAVRLRLELERYDEVERKARWRTIGGIGGLVLGAGLTAAAIAVHSDASSLRGRYLALDPLVAPQSQFDDLASRSRTRYGISYALGAVALAAFGAGTWMLISNPYRDRLAEGAPR